MPPPGRQCQIALLDTQRVPENCSVWGKSLHICCPKGCGGGCMRVKEKRVSSADSCLHGWSPTPLGMSQSPQLKPFLIFLAWPHPILRCGQFPPKIILVFLEYPAPTLKHTVRPWQKPDLFVGKVKFTHVQRVNSSLSFQVWSQICVLSHSVLSDFVTPRIVAHQAPLSTGILQARILEWVGHALLQGIFPTQGLNQGLPHYRWILYHLSHQESKEIYWPSTQSQDTSQPAS